MKKYDVAGHEPSFLPEERNWKLVWSDEFDGYELDRTKWDYRMCMMGKVHPAWTDKGVHLDGNSNAVFTVIEENGKPVSSQLQTGYNFMDTPIQSTKFGSDSLQWNIGKLNENKYTKKYGYFECRCKLQKKAGWWSAFWIQSPIIGASLDWEETGSEIDIMESFRPGEIAPHTIYTGGYGLDNKKSNVGGWQKGYNLNVYHTFGLWWDENGYTFYVDGKEDGHIDQYVSKRPEFILISTEIFGYRKENREATDEAKAAVGDTFTVDYVRAFEEV